MALDFIAGCIGGCAGIIAAHPLDTLKVHVQMGRGNIIQCSKSLLKGGSLYNAYRGVGAPLCGVAAMSAVVYGVYGNTRRALPNPDSIYSHVTAGAMAGTVQSFVCTPVELVKTRQQLATPEHSLPTGPLSGARHIYRSEGFRALFRGLGVTITRDCPSFAIYFGTYNAMTCEESGFMTIFVAGGTAGILAWVLSYPMDVVKSRIQGDVIRRYTGACDCFVKSVQTDGWKCMGRGIVAACLRAFVSNGAFFSAVAWTERLWQYISTQASSSKVF